MAKLTEEQKVANKLVRKERDKRYHARRQEHSAAQVQMEAQKEALPGALAAKAADAQLDAAMEERTARRGELTAKIAKLQEDLNALDAHYTAVVEPLRQARRDAWSTFHAEGRRLEEQLAARFPDLEGAWGPAGWRPELIPATT